MDDGNLISKYLLDPSFLRELYLIELATTIALIRENMLTTTDSFVESSSTQKTGSSVLLGQSSSGTKKQRRVSG